MGKVISIELWRQGLKGREQTLYKQLARFPELPSIRWRGRVDEMRRVLAALRAAGTKPEEVA